MSKFQGHSGYIGQDVVLNIKNKQINGGEQGRDSRLTCDFHPCTYRNISSFPMIMYITHTHKNKVIHDKCYNMEDPGKH